MTEALKISIEVIEGIGQMHSKNVIHLGLCPAHIMINRNAMSSKFIDFSGSTVLTRHSSTTKMKHISQVEWISPGNIPSFYILFFVLGIY